MKMTFLRKLLMLSSTSLFISVSAISAYAQIPPGAELLPPGFKLVGERNLGGATIIIDAKKPNQNFPKPHMDQGIDLRIMWYTNPAIDSTLEMLAKQPEDPPSKTPGSATRDEPCGRQRYQGGVLNCRKAITPWIGGGTGPDLITYTVGWGGKNATGAVGISVNRFYGTKEGAISLIDYIIPKITKAK